MAVIILTDEQFELVHSGNILESDFALLEEHSGFFGLLMLLREPNADTLSELQLDRATYPGGSGQLALNQEASYALQELAESMGMLQLVVEQLGGNFIKALFCAPPTNLHHPSDPLLL